MPIAPRVQDCGRWGCWLGKSLVQVFQDRVAEVLEAVAADVQQVWPALGVCRGA